MKQQIDKMFKEHYENDNESDSSDSELESDTNSCVEIEDSNSEDSENFRQNWNKLVRDAAKREFVRGIGIDKIDKDLKETDKTKEESIKEDTVLFLQFTQRLYDIENDKELDEYQRGQKMKEIIIDFVAKINELGDKKSRERTERLNELDRKLTRMDHNIDNLKTNDSQLKNRLIDTEYNMRALTRTTNHAVACVKAFGVGVFSGVLFKLSTMAYKWYF